LRRIISLDRSYWVLPLAHRRDVKGDVIGQKIEPRCGIDTRTRGSGHGYYFLMRKVFT
jgi:hypothetical protein